MGKYLLLSLIVLPLGYLGLYPDNAAEDGYVETYKDIAIREMERTGIPASIKLAQAILESDAGRSTLAREANNHFGIKCGGDWNGPTYALTDDETDSRIFGYLVMHFLFEDAQILNVVVDLPYRGMGYAQRMIRQGVQEALRRDLKRMTLEVRKGNLPAVQLYQKLGFTITQVRRAYYSNGEDAYLMTLELVGERIEF